MSVVKKFEKEMRSTRMFYVKRCRYLSIGFGALFLILFTAAVILSEMRLWLFAHA